MLLLVDMIIFCALLGCAFELLHYSYLQLKSNNRSLLFFDALFAARN